MGLGRSLALPVATEGIRNGGAEDGAQREPRPTGRAPVLRSSYGGWKAPAKPHLCPAFPVPCSIRGRKF